jgi:hypothetical protein
MQDQFDALRPRVDEAASAEERAVERAVEKAADQAAVHLRGERREWQAALANGFGALKAAMAAKVTDRWLSPMVLVMCPLLTRARVETVVPVYPWVTTFKGGFSAVKRSSGNEGALERG